METIAPPQPVAPTAAAAPVAPTGPQATTGDWIGGVLISLLLPVIGLIVGIVYVLKGGTKRTVGITCLAISTPILLAFVALTAAG